MTAYPPEWYTEADAARARAEATADGPDPESTVDGAGCAQRDLDAYLDWAGNQPTMTQSEFESRQAAAAAAARRWRSMPGSSRTPNRRPGNDRMGHRARPRRLRDRDRGHARTP